MEPSLFLLAASAVFILIAWTLFATIHSERAKRIEEVAEKHGWTSIQATKVLVDKHVVRLYDVVTSRSVGIEWMSGDYPVGRYSPRLSVTVLEIKAPILSAAHRDWRTSLTMLPAARGDRYLTERYRAHVHEARGAEWLEEREDLLEEADVRILFSDGNKIVLWHPRPHPEEIPKLVTRLIGAIRLK